MSYDDPRPASSPPISAFRVPRQTAFVGMWLFLIALTMLFGSSLLGYGLIRSRGPEAGSVVHLPRLLWLSTAIIILSSFTFHMALRSIEHERQHSARQWLMATMALAIGFVLVQTPALWNLLQQHRGGREQKIHLYGLIFFLVLLHALHVIGGLIGLGRVIARAQAGAYDHEHHDGMRLAGMYWHFLDIIWIVMFAVLLATTR